MKMSCSKYQENITVPIFPFFLPSFESQQFGLLQVSGKPDLKDILQITSNDRLLYQYGIHSYCLESQKHFNICNIIPHYLNDEYLRLSKQTLASITSKLVKEVLNSYRAIRSVNDSIIVTVCQESTDKAVCVTVVSTRCLGGKEFRSL